MVATVALGSVSSSSHLEPQQAGHLPTPKETPHHRQIHDPPSRVKTDLMSLPLLPSYSVRSGFPEYRRPRSQSVPSGSYGHSIRKGLAGVCDLMSRKCCVWNIKNLG